MRKVKNALRKSALVCALALVGMAQFNVGRAATAVTTLYAFAGGSDGATPDASVIDKQGNLYGTTTSGGGNDSCNSGNLYGTASAGGANAQVAQPIALANGISVQ